MGMKISRYDIGAEIISCLTKGMYPDPRDALREYVQNGIDAEASSISIKIRGDSVVVEDDGTGMDIDAMRRAVRIGISDKTPNIDVGFRGIGIYSAFHLCDRLHVYSKRKNSQTPHVLAFNFRKMRDVLNHQQAARLRSQLPGHEMVDLQKLLEQHIDLTELEGSKFAQKGTRVEMINLETNFFRSLSKFEEVAEYLQQVVPLHFNKDKFKWGELIEAEIQSICTKHNAEFRVIDLTLQVNMQIEKLCRAYTDEHFEEEPLEPSFKELKVKRDFFGIAWGCLNSARKKIKEKELRGLLIKKQGFAIGRRASIVKYFGRSTFFDRYIGEVVVTHPNLLPNAARSDFEVSPLRTLFYEALSGIAVSYNEEANQHQEFTKGDEELQEAISSLKKIEADFAFRSENAEQLVDIIVQVRRIKEAIQGRIKRQVLRPEKKADAQNVVQTAKSLEKDIEKLINRARKKTKPSAKSATLEERSQKRISKLPKVKPPHTEARAPASLGEVFDQLDITISDQLRILLDHIDERFIQGLATNQLEYSSILKELKGDFEDMLSEE